MSATVQVYAAMAPGAPGPSVSATSDDAGMTITMRSYGFTWTDPDGIPRASAAAYDGVSADRRREELEEAGATGIERVKVEPGELPTPRR